MGDDRGVATVTLRRMSRAQFGPFAEANALDFAQSLVAAGDFADLKTAVAAATQELADLLPDGPHTEGHAMYVAEDDGRRVGSIWIQLQRGRNPHGGWIFDVLVDPSERGKGYGRAIMLAIETEARALGVQALGLNVFHANAVARSLYESLGYETTSVHMLKPLSAAGDA
jgi:GNAT superfamily N-acetyltransferase